MVLEACGLLMDQAVLSESMIPVSMVEDEKIIQNDLLHLLVLTTIGAALSRVRQVPTGNGLEAWRKLRARHEPVARGQKLGLLNLILGLQIKAEGIGIMDLLHLWEQEVTKCDQKGEALNDDIKVAEVTSVARADAWSHRDRTWQHCGCSDIRAVACMLLCLNQEQMQQVKI